MKKIFEAALMLLGVSVFFFGLFRADFWGMLLGAGLVFAPFTAGAMFLMYAAMIGIPFGLGIIFAIVANDIFGKGLMSGVAFFAGLFMGGKFVISDTFGSIFTKHSSESDRS
ncbi:MAG: hypothetical protein ACEQSD_01155 [Flavobacteriales bacterium]